MPNARQSHYDMGSGASLDLSEIAQTIDLGVRFDLAFESAAIGMAVQEVSGKYLRVNREFCRLVGYSEKELLKKSWQDLTHPDDIARGQEWLRKDRFEGQSKFVTEKRYVRADGSILWALLTLSVIEDVSGRSEFVFAQIYDITDSKRVQELQQHLAAIIESSDDAIFSIDVDGFILTWNAGAERHFGYSAAEVLGRSLVELVPSERGDEIRAAIEGLKAGDPVEHFETMFTRSNGRRVLTSLTMSPIKDVTGVMSSIAITSRNAAMFSVRDSLTSLANRTLFIDRIEHAVARYRRHGLEFAILFLDMDDFKTVNDGLGHAAGDQLLRAVAHRLKSCLRDEDTAARLGGDEFAVLLENLPDPGTPELVADRIVKALEAPVSLGQSEIFVRASIGIARSSDAPAGSTDILRNADLAMYTAKRSGKSRYEIFQPSMHAAALARLNLKADIQRAIAREEFLLQYQPIIDMVAHRIVGFEALLRWDNRDRGLRPPAEFIPVAEETGWMSAIDHWVLEQACLQAQQWRRLHNRDDLQISVNVSRWFLHRPGLVADIGMILDRCGLPPKSLVLEITEHVLVQHSNELAEVTSELHDLGVRFAIDDFGTGSSALAYLRQFPVDYLKIDRSFTSSVDEAGPSATLAKAIIGLARNLQIAAVAEGVERTAQAERLPELGCLLGQGYLFGAPMDAAAVDDLLHEGGAGRFKAG